MLTYLPFDSQLFGYRVMAHNGTDLQKKTLKKIVKYGEKSKTKLIYIFLEEQLGKKALSLHPSIRLVDEKITFSANIPPLVSMSSEEYEKTKQTQIYTNAAKNAHPKHSICIYTKKLITSQLYKLSLLSGHYSRFKTDNRFNQNEHKKLFNIWIEKSVTGKIADVSLIAEKHDQSDSLNRFELGLLTLSNHKTHAEIGLVAIDEQVQGQGIGSNLLDKAKHLSQIWRLSEMRVITQKRNESACQFYQKNGFSIQNIRYVYHLWLR